MLNMAVLYVSKNSVFCFSMRLVCGIIISFPKVEANWLDMSEETDKKVRKPKSDARISGEIATYVLLFLAVFTGLLVFIAS